MYFIYVAYVYGLYPEKGKLEDFALKTVPYVFFVMVKHENLFTLFSV